MSLFQEAEYDRMRAEAEAWVKRVRDRDDDFLNYATLQYWARDLFGESGLAKWSAEVIDFFNPAQDAQELATEIYIHAYIVSQHGDNSGGDSNYEAQIEKLRDLPGL